MKRHSILTTIIFFASCAAAGLAGLLYLLVPRSGQAILVMQRRMLAAKSLTFDVRLDYDGIRKERNELGTVKELPESFNFATHGTLDRSEAKNTRAAQQFELSLGADKSLEFAGLLNSVADDHYLRLTKTPERVGNFSLSSLTNFWMRVVPRTIREQINAPFFGAGQEFTEVEREEFISQVRATPYFDFEGKLTEDMTVGRKAFHYGVTPELLYVKDTLLSLERHRLGRDLTEGEQKVFDRFFGNLRAVPGELWISKNNYYLHRALLRFRYDDGVRAGLLTVDARFASFNEPIESITAPPGVIKDAGVILASFLPGIREHLPMAKLGKVKPSESLIPEELELKLPTIAEVLVGTEALDDPDQDGLDSAFETFYGTNPGQADTDGDGMNDGDEVAQGRNPNGSGGIFDFGLSDALNKKQ